LDNLRTEKQQEAARLEQLVEEVDAHKRRKLEAEAKTERLVEEN